MDLALNFNPDQLFKLNRSVEAYNSTLNLSESTGTVLGKDDFLRLLITQLTHQDPTQPLEDQEFIAQMAQFSTLEQIMGMGEEISKLSNLINYGQALSLLGKTVRINTGDESITGTVKEVTGGETPRIFVDNQYYSISDIETVILEQGG